jgi:hypothetical protein
LGRAYKPHPLNYQKGGNCWNQLALGSSGISPLTITHPLIFQHQMFVIIKKGKIVGTKSVLIKDNIF